MSDSELYDSLVRRIESADGALKELSEQAAELTSANQAVSDAAAALKGIADAMRVNADALADAAKNLGDLSLESVTSRLDELDDGQTTVAAALESLRDEHRERATETRRAVGRTAILVVGVALVSLAGLIVSVIT